MFENWTSKDFRKAAFGVGFGFTFGRQIALSLLEAGDYFASNMFKKQAENNDEDAKNICKHFGIKYDDKNKEETKCKIGFNV